MTQVFEIATATCPNCASELKAIAAVRAKFQVDLEDPLK